MQIIKSTHVVFLPNSPISLFFRQIFPILSCDIRLRRAQLHMPLQFSASRPPPPQFSTVYSEKKAPFLNVLKIKIIKKILTVIPLLFSISNWKFRSDNTTTILVHYLEKIRKYLKMGLKASVWSTLYTISTANILETFLT